MESLFVKRSDNGAINPCCQIVRMRYYGQRHFRAHVGSSKSSYPRDGPDVKDA